MEYLIGIGLAVAVAGLAAGVGFDHDRSFAPTILIVIASYYVLFAAIGDRTTPCGRVSCCERILASGGNRLQQQSVAHTPLPCSRMESSISFTAR
jgi:hypothetical protein